MERGRGVGRIGKGFRKLLGLGTLVFSPNLIRKGFLYPLLMLADNKS
jgi:hypothetical protein